ncbi:MAG: hypothetical protein AB7U29_07395 [Desulfobulbus sp.]
MKDKNSSTYKGWNIRVHSCEFVCGYYSFDLTDPCGKTSHVRLGGDSRERAMERAMEMINLEMASDEPKCAN